MKIVEKNIDELQEYENNPRFNDGAVDAVAASIDAFGFKVPIIVDRNNVIVAGHTRLKAARQLGKKKVPCIVADDLTDDQIKAFRLADNKTAELAGWDFAKLDAELDEIEMDMAQFGFEIEYDEMPTELDKTDEKTGVQLTVTFDDYTDYKCVANDIKNLIETNNGVFTVKMI